MYGRSVGQDKAQVAPGPTRSRAGGGRQYSSSQMSGVAQSFPIVLALLFGLYFLWAIVEQHEKLKSAIKPQNVGLNLRNIGVILITVILGLNLLKILSGKLCAWGVPGSKWFVTLVGGA